MKKTIVLLTIVLALLAAPVFAEITAYGEVDFEWAFNADDYGEKINDNEAAIDLGAMVGDYTSIVAEFDADYDDADNTIDDSDADERDVQMSTLTITQDITGALGLDSPVSVALTVGVDGMGDDPVNYNEIAAYNFAADAQVAELNSIKTMLTFGIDTITVDVAMWEDYLFGINAYGTVADMADVSVYYYSEDQSLGEVECSAFGANFAMMVTEDIKVGAGFESFSYEENVTTGLDAETNFGVSVAYTMDALTAGLSAATWYADEDDYSMAENTAVALDVTYSVSEMMDVFAAIGSVIDAGDMDFADVVFYEAGAQAFVDGVTYTAGYTLSSDWNAYDAGFMDGADRAGNFFVRMQASF